MGDARSERLSMDLHRLPFDHVDPTDIPTFRAWLLNNLAARFVLSGTLKPALMFIGSGFIEEGDLPRADDLVAEPLLARLFLQAGTRSGILHRLRVGEVHLRDGAGALRRCIAVLCFEPAGEGGSVSGPLPEGRWWAAWRIAGQLPGGQGEFPGAWEQQEGTSLAELPPGLRDWLDPGRSQVDEWGVEEHQERPKGGPPIEWGHRELPESLPQEPLPLLQAVLQALGPGLVRGQYPPCAVLTSAGRSLDTYGFRADLPVPIDEFVRLMAKRDSASVAGLIVPGVLESHGRHQRAIAVLVECGGQRIRACLPLLAKDDQRESTTATVQGPEPIGQKGWIGVEPKVSLDFHPIFGTPCAEA